MKRFFLVGALLSFVVPLFSGCSLEGTFKDDAEITSETGVLVEQLTADDVHGTHILKPDSAVSDSKAVDIPLRSLSLNLSSSSYLGNKVQVIGFMNEDDGVFEVTGISVVEVLHTTEKEASFIEYENTDFGIRLKYYDNWNVVEDSASVSFEEPLLEDAPSGAVGGRVVISQVPFEFLPTLDEDNNETSALDSFIMQKFPDLDDSNMSHRLIGPDALDAFKVKNGDDLSYYFYRNGLIYSIDFIFSKYSSADSERIFDEMMAEFEFTGFTVDTGVPDSADLESVVDGDETYSSVGVPMLDESFSSFESLPFSFAGVYPASWYYAGTSGDSGNVLRHYGFSDETVLDDNELISLDVVTSPLPGGGTVVSGKNNQIKVVQSEDSLTVYTELEGKVYKLSGDSKYKDYILYMADNLSTIEPIAE